jgi:hypothetical protein
MGNFIAVVFCGVFLFVVVFGLIIVSRKVWQRAFPEDTNRRGW